MAFGIASFSQIPFSSQAGGSVSVAVTGSQLTGSVGASTVIGHANINVTGIQLSANIGSITTALNTPVNVTGSQLTMSMGEETPVGNAIVSVTGSQLTGTLGTYSISADGNVSVVVTEHDMVTSIGTLQSVTGDANVNVTGVQLEAGTAASDFEFLPFDVNIDRCQRYFQKSFKYGDAPGTGDSNGMATAAGNTGSGSSTGQCIVTTSLVKQMRSTPTIVVYDNAGTSGKVYGIKYGVNEYAAQAASSFRVGNKYFGVERSSGDSIITFSFHYTASSEL